jgi:hypothetical protein
VLKRELRLRELEIPHDVSGRDPLRLVRYAEQRARERGGYDYIFCVFDRDTHSTFGDARRRIKELSEGKRSLPIREAISVPAFELWVLLHFEQVESPFGNSDAIIRRLREAGYIPDYRKADRGMCQRIVGLVNDAVQRAERLENRACAAQFDNPYTNVHKLVQVLQALAATD